MAIREEEVYKIMERLRRRIAAIVDDADTAEALKPYYRFLCKRPCSSDEYLPTFNRPNVTLVDVSESKGVDRLTEKAQEALQTKFPGALPVLLTDFEAITAQLGDFEKTLREERSSLSGYRTCRLLLRTGFPVDLEGNANMLRVGLTEMREAGHPSIDNKCSLCTGTFASCLGLAGDGWANATAQGPVA